MTIASTRGIWIDFLAHMWNAPERGVIEGSPDQLRRLLGCTKEEFDTFVSEAEQLKFCDISVTLSRSVTPESRELLRIRNRRMVREEKSRNQATIRQRRHREGESPEPQSRDSHADITHASSSSSSSSSASSKRERNTPQKTGSEQTKQSKRKLGTPLPNGFTLTDKLRQIAIKHGLDPQHEFDQFVADARSEDRHHVNWDAAFEKWCLKSVEFRRSRTGNGKSPATTITVRDDQYWAQEGKS